MYCLYLNNYNKYLLSLQVDQFEKIGKNDVLDLKIPYDVNSIMQYPQDAFQKPGITAPTMVAIDKTKPIPPYIMDRRLSSLDVLAVKRFYQCPI